MKEIGDLGLTLKQTLEVSTYDSLLVSAWLNQVDDPDIPNATAWFLTGVRSGVMPQELRDVRREKAILRAQRWIVNAGYACRSEVEVVDELFGRNGPLRDFAADEILGARMVALWRQERPRGEALERETEERFERLRATVGPRERGRGDAA